MTARVTPLPLQIRPRRCARADRTEWVLARMYASAYTSREVADQYRREPGHARVRTLHTADHLK